MGAFIGLLSTLDAGPFLLRVDPDAAQEAGPDTAAGLLMQRALGALRRGGHHEKGAGPPDG